MFLQQICKKKSRKHLFTIATEGIKYPGINLTKEMKDIYTEKPQITDGNKGRQKEIESVCLWVGRINTV